MYQEEGIGQMKTEMVMPQMGESIAEATILKWLKAPGDMVEKDENILEISTDKVDTEVPAPASGKLVEIKAVEGETVAVKSVIAIIDSDASAAATSTKAAPAKAEAAPQPVAAAPAPQPAAAQAPVAPVAGSSDIPSHSAGRFYSPLVRSMAAQAGLSEIELASVRGSGANGRVTKEDLEFFLQHRGSAPQAAATPAAAPAAAKGSAPAPRPAYGPEGTKVEPFDNMRRIIAEHMVRSKHTSPHVYSMAEVDVTNIAKWRKKNQDAFLAREGFKLSFTPFFLEATVQGLMNFPKINASVDGENLILKRDVNLGCAVALGKDGMDGLIVPVIKNADQLNFTGIARGLNDIAQRARTKKLKPEDVQGGTFTVTNPGIFGNIMGCPIINQPQLAILALGAIKRRPVVVDDAIAIRDIVMLTLSYDHRIIDGALSGMFLSFVTNYLENWDMSRGI
jgi:2-oxoglutarate dehydrogenase dihydrolipoamide succinyltransferase (E2 component)